MGYIVPTNSALKFNFGPWHCAMWAADDSSGFGLGQSLMVGYESTGNGWINIGSLWGPGDMASAVAAKGGMGNFLVPFVPAANAMCKQYFNTKPGYPPLDNTSPFSVDNMNIALYEYFQAKPSADGTYPVISVKAYP